MFWLFIESWVTRTYSPLMVVNSKPKVFLSHDAHKRETCVRQTNDFLSDVTGLYLTVTRAGNTIGCWPSTGLCKQWMVQSTTVHNSSATAAFSPIAHWQGTGRSLRLVTHSCTHGYYRIMSMSPCIGKLSYANHSQEFNFTKLVLSATFEIVYFWVM